MTVLHIVYRSTGTENAKRRPAFYSKRGSLLSLLRSVEEAGGGADLTFLNDGPIPAERLELMSGSGRVVSLSELPLPAPARVVEHNTAGSAGLTRSYLQALAFVERQGWADDDLVYFVEDDYLHLPAALQRLRDAAQARPEASYFALYGTIDWRVTVPMGSHGHDWYVGDSTTSTFAARVGALRADKWIHRLAFFAGGTADRSICFAYAGTRPFRWAHMAGDLLGSNPGDQGAPAGRLKRAGLQTAMNLLAIRYAMGRRLLVISHPALAMHVENHAVGDSSDWESLAADTRRWAEARGLSAA